MVLGTVDFLHGSRQRPCYRSAAAQYETEERKRLETRLNKHQAQKTAELSEGCDQIVCVHVCVCVCVWHVLTHAGIWV